MCLVALVLPYSPLGTTLGFVPLPPLYFLILIMLVGTYIALVEFVKSKFLQKYRL